ncbi:MULTISPECIES: hypothetical protein [unclassified Cyanobium]|uniref:hypothetical protein n=1 Tax=unclassified Cyanobium TaxID=2627006 RepID=UPI0020CE1F38|nr:MULTISPECIES: hypothetical protein [unclassified Cyanobium]MCP9937672.1 hypothetical protein [Cyanobium sp. Aljojuca 7A6]
MASTFKSFHSDIDFILVLSDIYPTGISLDIQAEPFDQIVFSHELGIPDFWQWSFKHNVVELCTAVKPAAGLFFLSLGYDQVMYIDPDIAVFASLESLFALLGTHSGLLTPHQLTVAPGDLLSIKDIELCTLKHGLYNLGFYAARNDQQGRSFLEWWNSRVQRFCYEDVPSGIFTDQKWCDFAPIYFDNFFVVRDPGCNVASWNIHERAISITDTGPVVNTNYPLRFYHFTKFGGAGLVMTQQYAKTAETIEIWFWYGRMLQEMSHNLPPSGHYYYGHYQDGHKIPQAERDLYRTCPEIFPSIPYKARRSA